MNPEERARIIKYLYDLKSRLYADEPKNQEDLDTIDDISLLITKL